jgi:hypothetical protein
VLHFAQPELACRDSAAPERDPVWVPADAPALARLVYVAERGVWSTDITGYRKSETADLGQGRGLTERLRWSYDAVVNANVGEPLDVAVGADGRSLALAGRRDIAVTEICCTARRDDRMTLFGRNTQFVTASAPREYALQPSWQALPTPLPASADGRFDRRTNVTARLDGRRLRLVNRNRFWVSGRAGRTRFTVPPATRTRPGRRSVRVARATRRVVLRDVSGQRRRLPVPRPRSG